MLASRLLGRRHPTPAATETSAVPTSHAGPNEPDSAILSGPPSLAFAQRCHRKSARLSVSFDVLALVVILTSAFRHTRTGPLPPEGVLYLAAYGSACAAAIATYLLARPAYVLWLELSGVLLRLSLLGMGAGAAGWSLSRRLLDQPVVLTARAGTDGTALGYVRWLLGELDRHAVHGNRLLFASHALPMAHVALCRPLRLSLSIAAQVVLVAHSLSQVTGICTAAQLATPEAQRLTHHLFAAVSPAALFMPLPSPAALEPPPAATECTALVRFLQLTLGLLAPLAWQAATESALFAAHQRQRAAAGLPVEQGHSACLYGAIEGLKDPVIRPHLCLMGAMAVGLCWQAAVGFSRPLPTLAAAESS